MKNCKMLKLKKGITIVEAVITLVLIGIIMVSAVSVVLMSIDVENNSNTAVELKNSAENILECFRFAETEEEFETAIKKCGNYIKDEEGNFVLVGGNVTVTVTADCTEKTLKYLAVDSKGKELYSFNFPYMDETSSETTSSSEVSSTEENTSTEENSSTEEVSSTSDGATSEEASQEGEGS